MRCTPRWLAFRSFRKHRPGCPAARPIQFGGSFERSEVEPPVLLVHLRRGLAQGDLVGRGSA
jgi:hypothetical protein